MDRRSPGEEAEVKGSERTRILGLVFIVLVLCVLLSFQTRAAEPARPRFPWLAKAPDPASRIERRIPPPAGFEREAVAEGSFGEWLRQLPLKAAGAPVLHFDGSRKPNQEAHAAVVDLDLGKRDLEPIPIPRSGIRPAARAPCFVAPPRRSTP